MSMTSGFNFMQSIQPVPTIELNLYTTLKNAIISDTNWKIYNAAEIVNIFGQDMAGGIDICCTYGTDLIFCIYCKQGSSVNIKDMTHFIYCCNSIYNAEVNAKRIPINLYKIWGASFAPMGQSFSTAVEREKIVLMCESVQQTLVDRMVQRMNLIFTEYKSRASNVFRI